MRSTDVATPRRALLRGAGATLAAAVLAPRLGRAQTAPPAPPSTVTQPPRDFAPGAAPTTYFTDPDVLSVEPEFNGLRQANAAIQRLWTGGYELDGSATVVAAMFEGKRLNSPNDVVAHPDGSYWFTDPPYGAQLYEGTVDAPGGPANPGGRLNPRLGQPPEFGSYKRELPTAVYRVDRSGAITQVAGEDIVPDPNGLCFSPDHRKLYVVSSGRGPGDAGPGGKREIVVFDVGSDNRLGSGRVFSDCMVDGIKCGPDGVRTDVGGNVWCSSNAGRALGYSGVTVWNPQGKLIGRIRLPEVCGNLCFGGPKRNRLFMAASQSLYALYTATQGAGPA